MVPPPRGTQVLVRTEKNMLRACALSYHACMLNVSTYGMISPAANALAVAVLNLTSKAATKWT